MRYERKKVVIQFLNNDYEGTYRAVNFLHSGRDQEVMQADLKLARGLLEQVCISSFILTLVW